MKKFNESLLKKSLLAIIIIALSVPATFFLSYNLIKAHAKNAALRDMAVIAESYKGQVCQFLEMARRRAQDFASDGFMRTRLPKEIRGREGSVNNLSKYLAENKFTLDESIKTIHVLSMEGRVVASTDNSEIGKDLSRESFFIKGKDAITLVENTAVHDGLPELAVSAPIFNMSKKKAIGVLVNTIRLSELNKMLSGEYHMEDHSILWNKGRWKSIEVYLVNKNKLMITNSISVHPLPLNSVKEPTPSPSQEGNTKSPLLGGDLGVGELLQNAPEQPQTQGQAEEAQAFVLTDKPLEIWTFIDDYRVITGKTLHLTVQVLWKLGITVNLEGADKIDLSPFRIEGVTIGERQIFDNEHDYIVITYTLSLPSSVGEGIYSIPSFTLSYRNEVDKTEGKAASSPVAIKKVPILVEGKVDKDVITIGDRINYALTIRHEKNVRIIWESLGQVNFSPLPILKKHI